MLTLSAGSRAHKPERKDVVAESVAFPFFSLQSIFTAAIPADPRLAVSPFHSRA